MKRLLLLTIVLACSIHHRVTLLLGPSKDQPSSGFACADPATGRSLFTRALVGTSLEFQIVVDLIDVGQHVPSCVGEDILAACKDGTCQTTVTDAPTRYCAEITVENLTDVHGIVQQIVADLEANPMPISASAPHHPVIVRAVATTEPCSTVQHSTSGVWNDLDKNAVLGCAFSCPVDLDSVDGELSLGIGVDATQLAPAQCVAVIQTCATGI